MKERASASSSCRYFTTWVIIDASPSMMKNRKDIPSSSHDAFIQNSDKQQLMETNLSVAADLRKSEKIQALLLC